MFYVFAGSYSDDQSNCGWKSMRSSFYTKESALLMAQHLIHKAGFDWCHAVDEEDQEVIWDSTKDNKDDV